MQMIAYVALSLMLAASGVGDHPGTDGAHSNVINLATWAAGAPHVGDLSPQHLAG